MKSMDPNIHASFVGVHRLPYICTMDATTYVAKDAFCALVCPQLKSTGCPKGLHGALKFEPFTTNRIGFKGIS
jgi:hypothetical protein